jgi:hypothetical protein
MRLKNCTTQEPQGLAVLEVYIKESKELWALADFIKNFGARNEATTTKETAQAADYIRINLAIRTAANKGESGVVVERPLWDNNVKRLRYEGYLVTRNARNHSLLDISWK